MTAKTAAVLKAQFKGTDPAQHNEDLVDSMAGSAAGVTASADELNILDGATLSTAELNTLDGITATVAELNILDGVTASTAEINKLDNTGTLLASGTQQANIPDLTVIFTINNPSITPNGSVTFADGSSVTVAELLEAFVELRAKQVLILDALQAFGAMAA